MNSNCFNLSSISSVVDSDVAPKFCQKTTIYILKMLNKLCNTRKLVPSFLLLDEVCSSLKFGENIDEKELINILQNIVWITKIKIEENDVSALKLIASKLLKVNKHSVGESFNDEKYNIFSIKNRNFIGESDGDYITTKTPASTSTPIKNSISLSSNKPSSTISSNPIDSNLQCSTAMLPLTNSNNFEKSQDSTVVSIASNKNLNKSCRYNEINDYDLDNFMIQFSGKAVILRVIFIASENKEENLKKIQFCFLKDGDKKLSLSTTKFARNLKIETVFSKTLDELTSKLNLSFNDFTIILEEKEFIPHLHEEYIRRSKECNAPRILLLISSSVTKSKIYEKFKSYCKEQVNKNESLSMNIF